MNKTVSINLAGIFFHIDEDAYETLQNYFEAIKTSLQNTPKAPLKSLQISKPVSQSCFRNVSRPVSK